MGDLCMQESTKDAKMLNHIFTGNIYIFHAFDVGDDINLEQIEKNSSIKTVPLALSKYFKNYHIPLGVALPNSQQSPYIMSCKVHNFGTISLSYKISFKDTLENIRKEINALDFEYYEQSLQDVKSIYALIKESITKAHFYQTRSSYVVIQVDPELEINITYLKEQFGAIIASALRFEMQSLSEYQKNEILESAVGYFRGELIIIDTYASFLYDADYVELLDFFEFANIQLLELRYFDRVLDQQLNLIYEGRVGKVPLTAYFPFIGAISSDPVDFLGKLKADISVITERLEGSIKIAGEPYYSEIYDILIDRLDLKNWKEAIDRKLEIIKDVQLVYQHKIDSIKEDTLSTLIIILIFIELVVALLRSH